MVKVLIAYSGGGKTSKIKTEIINKYYGEDDSSRDVYIIEREDYPEYSRVFNMDFFHILKPSSDMSFLDEISNCDIYVDCECMADEFMEKIAKAVKKARTRNNNITITYLDIENSEYQRSIFANADEVMVGKCDVNTEQCLEAMFSQRLKPQQTRYDFRQIGYVEGCDCDMPTAKLEFPFTISLYKGTCKELDKLVENIWNEIHETEEGEE